MIRALFYRQDGRLRGVTLEGHAGYAPAGEDIVCAAITGALRYCETLLSLSGREYSADVVKASTRVTLYAQPQPALEGLYRFIIEISREYPKNIRVTEVRYA